MMEKAQVDLQFINNQLKSHTFLNIYHSHDCCIAYKSEIRNKNDETDVGGIKEI